VSEEVLRQATVLIPFYRDEAGQLRPRSRYSPSCPRRTASSGYLVWPFVARLHDVSPASAWRPQPPEVAEVLDVPVAELASPDAARTEADMRSKPGGLLSRAQPIRSAKD